MKKFTLIEADKYIGIDNVGIFFTEDNWPFHDIEHLWAIQWSDNGTPDGSGHVEYDSPVPNTPATRSMIERYVDHWQKEFDRQAEEKRRLEEQDKKNSLSWQEAMRELEEQMEEMQQRHEQSLDSMREDHEKQMERVHQRVAEAHENLFYGNEQIKGNLSESERAFEFENGYDNLTVFEDNVDPALFDDVVDASHFNVEEANSIDANDLNLESLITNDFASKSEIDSFTDIDLSLLDSEFNLELLFEEDASEQVVSEIEKLIAEESEEVPDAEIPDN